MSANVKIKETEIKSDMLYAAAVHLAVAVCGFSAARAPVLQLFTPFGIAFAAGMPKNYIITAGIGAAAGYFIPVTGGGFRYFAALFAVCTIRLLLCGVGKFEKMPLFSSITAFAAALFTALATVAGGGFSPLYAILESVLAGSGAYFTHRSAVLLSRERGGLNSEQLACTVMTANILLMGLYPITVGGISIGRIAVTAAVLTAALFIPARRAVRLRDVSLRFL